MIKRSEAWLMGVLRVPGEPSPPAGAPGSLRVFRAGRNYVRLKFVGWMGAQLAAIWGVLVSIYFIREVEYQMNLVAAQPQGVANEEAPVPVLVEVEPGVYVTRDREPDLNRDEIVRRMVAGETERRDVIHRVLDRMVPPPVYDLARMTPPRVFFWIKVGEAVGLVVFVVQFFWSLGALWLDYTQRWYMVTDRSLRLRWGIVKIQETTMSFANLQQVTVKQGPLQRLLKLADVEVRSAGGGSGGSEMEQKDQMHRSVFHAVENAAEVRDLILERLKRFRQAGLGEPDDANLEPAVESEEGMNGESHHLGEGVDVAALAAAQDVLAEVRALREGLR